MYKNLTITSLLGALTIIFGAFGAHALKKQLSAEAMQSFETAVRYQMYHVIILLAVNLYSGFTEKLKRILTFIFLGGVFFFSGSIYVISLGGVSAKTIWFITPFGGLLFIVGWCILFFKFLKMSVQGVA